MVAVLVTALLSCEVPLALRVTLPWAGLLSLVAVRVLPSASVSLARTLAAVLSRTVTVPPSATVALSLLATGAARPEEARVGKEGRPRWSRAPYKKKARGA